MDNSSPNLPPRLQSVLTSPTNHNPNSSPINAVKKSPGSCSSDSTLIQYVQEAITSIKALRQQCNVKSILTHLRQHHSDYPNVNTLTERELMHQLELGVKDGILSRKFNSNTPPVSSTLPATSSPAKAAVKPTNGNITDEICLPNIDQTLNESDKKGLNSILQLLMKTVATLTKTSFTEAKQKSPSAQGIVDEPSWCTLADILALMQKSSRFRPSASFNDSNRLEVINEHLRKVVLHLVNKQDKIFLKNVFDADLNKYKIRLNSSYIQEKLHATQQQAAIKKGRVKFKIYNRRCHLYYYIS